MTGIVRSMIVDTGRRIALVYKLGGRTLRMAPLLVAPAIVTELAQHAAEIHLGLFASRAAFRALAMDPTRWAFGYAKVAGFLLSILLVARFWAVDGDAGRIVRLGRRCAGRLALAILASAAVALIQRWFDTQGPSVSVAANLVDFLISIGLTIYMTGALFGDEAADLRWSFTTGWPRAVMMTLLAGFAFVPCQLVHLLDHRIAIGAPMSIIVIAMLWDALFVGLFAALVGSALFVGFRHGPGWRGWDTPLQV